MQHKRFATFVDVRHEVKNEYNDDIRIPIIIPKENTMLVQIVKSMGLMAVQNPLIIVRPQPYEKCKTKLTIA